MRSEEQRTRLTGLVWGPDCEPSHQLVDRFVAMCEEGVITYVKPELCTSRSHEILNMKHGQSFALGSDGNLRLKQSDADMECSVSGEMKLREAFRRRSLAMDLAQMVTYTVSEEWTSYLFMTLQRDAPRGFKQINIAQLIAADKRLWILMSEQSKGNVSAKPPADKPCDALLKHISSSPEVLNFLSPQPDIPDKASLRYDPYTIRSHPSRARAREKMVRVVDLQTLANHYPKDARSRRAMANPFVDSSIVESVGTKSKLENDALEGCIFAGSLVAIERSQRTSVRTQTDYRIANKFHCLRCLRLRAHQILLRSIIELPSGHWRNLCNRIRTIHLIHCRKLATFWMNLSNADRSSLRPLLEQLT